MDKPTMSVVRLGGATVALVAAAAGTLVASPAHAAAVVQSSGPAATSIAIRTVNSAVRPGATDIITGDLVVAGGSATGRDVTLEAHTPGQTGYAPVGETTAGQNGGLSLAVTPEVTTKYRWSYDGAADARPSDSGIVTVRVVAKRHHAHRLGTTLSIRANHHTVRPNGYETIRGRLRSGSVGLPHRLVLLEAYRAGQSHWHYVAGHETARYGAISFRVSPDQVTSYRLRFLGSQVFRPSHSGVVKIGVRSMLTISATPPRIDPGQASVISSVASDKGAAVVGATAELLARPATRHSHFTLVGTGGTAPDGAVAFSVSPKRDTVYRVRLLASASAPGGLSEPQKVVVTNRSSLSIRGRAASHHRYAVSGNLRSHGHAVQWARVTLESQAPGATAWTQVATHRTGHYGSVVFKRPQAPGTRYRLVFAGNAHAAPGVSGTVVN